MNEPSKGISFNREEIIRRYLDNMWDNMSDISSNVVFFNLINGSVSGYIDRFIDERWNKSDFEMLIFRNTIREERYQSPYFPFLDIVRDHLEENNIDIDQYIEDSGVYYFQRRIFSDYLKGLSTHRYDKILFEEMGYEKTQIMDSIFRLVSGVIGDKRAIISIDNLDSAKESTLEFIDHIIESDYTGDIMLIFSFSENNVLLHEDDKGYWSRFIQGVKERYQIIDYKGDSIEREDYQTLAQRNIDQVEVEELIKRSNDAFNLLALEEAEEYIKAAYKVHQNKSNEEEYFKVIKLMGDIYSYSNQNDTAIKYYQILLNRSEEFRQVKCRVDIYREIGFIYFKKYNMEQADKFAKRSLKIANEIKDKISIFRANLLICVIQEKWGKFNGEEWRDIYDILIPLAHELGLKNKLARCYINCYSVLSDYNFDEALKYHNKGLKIAKDYKNKYRVAIAYHMKAILYTRENDYQQVLKYSNMSKELKEEIGGANSLASIYNGLGYYHFLMESYEESYEYFSKALNCLRDAKDYTEIGITCMNIGFTMFLALDDKGAIFYLNETLNILNILNIKNLLYHSKSKIYSMLGISYIKSGQLNKAYECLIKVESKSYEEIIKECGDSFQFFFLELLKGMVAKEEGDYKKSKDHFEESLRRLDSVEFNKDHLYPRLYYEYGIITDFFGDKEGADLLFQKGLKLSDELDYNFHRDLILSYFDQEIEVKSFEFEVSNFDFKWFAESVELEDNLNKLYNQIDKIKFLNELQNILVEVSSKDILIRRAMSFIGDNFLIERSCFYIKADGIWKEHSSDGKLEVKESQIVKLIKEKKLAHKEELVYNNDEFYKGVIGDFSSVLSIPLKEEGEAFGIFIGISIKEDFKLLKDDFEILSIAAKQLSIALERLKKNEQLLEKNIELEVAYDKLLRFSKIDSLTGLYNRNELMMKLKSEEARINRYKGDNNVCSLVFIDLDNFKYYNDRFGHNVGDMVLCKFADLLRDEKREVDFVSRFGGDEFIIVLPETKVEDALILANRIRLALIDSNQFLEDIEGYLDKKVQIPKSNRLSSSIGISEYKAGMDIDIDELIRRADEAMYSSKKNGKDRVTLFKNS